MQAANIGWGASRIHGELLDHVIVMNERHLRWILRDYVDYYHTCRTHLSLKKIRLKLELLSRRSWVLLVHFPVLVACTIATPELQHDGDSKD